jgi:3-oxo-5-alpha-steroid 4-dehydrogenase 1
MSDAVVLREHPVFSILLLSWAVAGALAFLAISYIAAPYGRYARPGWGPGFSPRRAWFLMESPGVFIFVAILLPSLPTAPVPALFAVLWIGHYLYRGFLYPAMVRSTRRVPLLVVASAIAFHCANVSLQAWELYQLKPDRPMNWLTDPRFLAGLTMFACGFVVAVTSDTRLRRLRATRGEQYYIPRGGLFEWVSCPAYLGEIVEWSGWALMTWTWSGLVFALWTTANLLPRALAHHRWYRSHFADYPAQRKALIPYIL